MKTPKLNEEKAISNLIYLRRLGATVGIIKFYVLCN